MAYVERGVKKMDDHSTAIGVLKDKVGKFVEERNWNEYHNPKNLSMSIAIEAAELMEIFQWMSIQESWKISDSNEFEHLKEEIADIMIYCISLANQLNIDIAQAIQNKIKENEIRYPVQHGIKQGNEVSAAAAKSRTTGSTGD